MKVICLGGELAGFSPDSHAYAPSDLEDRINDGERIVLVCHGASLYVQLSDQEVQLSAELLKYHLHAVVLTHRADAASSTQVNELKKDLAQQCQRVFGLTRGWNTINAAQRARVIEFLESEELSPQDSEVQALLGYDSPVAKLALRVALEIALRELEGSRLPRSSVAEMSTAMLLSPALAIAQQ